MKKYLSFIVALAAVVSIFVSCEQNEGDTNALTAISINEADATIEIIDSLQLTISTVPENIVVSDLVWSSSDENVATVDSAGMVHPVGEGSATITVSSGSVSATATVTVFAEITDIEINGDAPVLNIGETSRLSVSLQPEDADVSKIEWTSNNERVATVSDNGTVTAIGYGSAYIYARYGNVSGYVRVTVNEPERNYKLVWEENFDGSVLDESSWNIAGGIPQNNEKQYYLKEQPLIENGCLVITAKDMGPLQKDEKGNDIPNSNPNWVEGKRYTSYRINTQGKRFIKYGKFEASISFPSGAGTWCAFWLMPNESVYGGWPRSGEIDIVEHVGSNPNWVNVAAHTYNRNGNVGEKGDAWSSGNTYENVADNFHTYGIEWIDDYQNGNDILIFTFDEVEVGRYSQTSWMNSDWKDWPFDQNFYVILNMAIGGQFGGAEPIDDSIFPVEMRVDWVRMYQLQ